MQTFLKVFGVLLVLFIVGGLVLDNKVDVSREIEINASTEAIHAYVEDLNQWPKWSPWQQMDPSMKTTIGEVSKGVGASQSWQGESGSGALIMTQSAPDLGIAYDMTFEGDPSVYVAGMSYQSSGGITRVTWYMRGEMGPIIIGNYFALLMDTLVGDSFTMGLEKLKQVVEAEPAG